MDLLVPAAGFAFEGHLSNWTIYDLKELFSNLAPWNMHLPTLHFLQQQDIVKRPSVLKRHSSLKLNRCRFVQILGLFTFW